MKSYMTLINSLFALTVIISLNAHTTRIVDVTNNSNQALRIAANSNDGMFKLEHGIPAYSRLFVTAQVTGLQTPEDMLFSGIYNNCVAEIERALRAGANINAERDGMTPLLYAALLKRANALRCLIQHGVL